MVLKKWLDVFSFGLYYKKHINKGYENTKEVINFTWQFIERIQKRGKCTQDWEKTGECRQQTKGERKFQEMSTMRWKVCGIFRGE